MTPIKKQSQTMHSQQQLQQQQKEIAQIENSSSSSSDSLNNMMMNDNDNDDQNILKQQNIYTSGEQQETLQCTPLNNQKIKYNNDDENAVTISNNKDNNLIENNNNADSSKKQNLEEKNNNSTNVVNQHILQLKSAEIIEVWNDNMEEELYRLMDLVEKYNVISVDTEFPGIVNRPQKILKSNQELEYLLLKENVNQLKLIQLGISICDENGNTPGNAQITWQFNFKFNINNEKYLNDAIQLLKNSGIDFDQLEQRGCEFNKFAETMICSGLIYNEDITWVCFHGGFDFTYFVKLLSNENIPEKFEDFNTLMKLYFPNFYDLKFMIKDLDNLKYNGLSKLADELRVKRIGPSHQAGSDSLLTLANFFKLKELYCKNDNLMLTKSFNILYGIGSNLQDDKDNYNDVWSYNNQNNIYQTEINTSQQTFYPPPPQTQTDQFSYFSTLFANPQYFTYNGGAGAGYNQSHLQQNAFSFGGGNYNMMNGGQQLNNNNQFNKYFGNGIQLQNQQTQQQIKLPQISDLFKNNQQMNGNQQQHNLNIMPNLGNLNNSNNKMKKLKMFK